MDFRLHHFYHSWVMPLFPSAGHVLPFFSTLKLVLNTNQSINQSIFMLMKFRWIILVPFLGFRPILWRNLNIKNNNTVFSRWWKAKFDRRFFSSSRKQDTSTFFMLMMFCSFFSFVLFMFMNRMFLVFSFIKFEAC